MDIQIRVQIKCFFFKKKHAYPKKHLASTKIKKFDRGKKFFQPKTKASAKRLFVGVNFPLLRDIHITDDSSADCKLNENVCHSAHK